MYTVVEMVLQILAVVDSLEGSHSGYLKQQSKKNKTKKVGVSVHVFFTLALILHLLNFSHSDYYKQMCDDGAKIVLVSSEPLMVLKCLQEVKCIQVTDSDHCDSVGYRAGCEFC